MDAGTIVEAGTFTVGYCTALKIRRLYYWSHEANGAIGTALIELDTDECGETDEIPAEGRFERYNRTPQTWAAEINLSRDNANEVFYWIDTHTGEGWSMTELVTDPPQKRSLWLEKEPMRFVFSFEDEVEAVQFKLAWG